MKINKISFKNIHSLRGEHNIDFSTGPLAEAGLFAITGATGSGKSTLLDVITLALYNKIARIDNPINKTALEGEGSVMTKNTKDCFAEVEYTVRGKIYRSHWSVKRNRNNNLNDRKQEVTEVSTGNIIESGKNTPNKNQEIIGLSYEQFSKAMVLSQGEFSKLLKEKRDERNKLLEDITGAKDYRKIGRAVFERFKIEETKRNEQEIKLGEIELLPEEEKIKLIEEKNSLDKENKKLKKDLDSLKEKVTTKGLLEEKEREFIENNTLQSKLDISIEDFKKEETTLKQHNKFVKHRDLLIDYAQKNKEVISTEEERDTVINKEKEAIKEKGRFIKKAVELTGKDVEEIVVLSELKLLEKTVLSLKNDEKSAISEITIYKNNLKTDVADISNFLKFNDDYTLFKRDLKTVTQNNSEFLKNTIFKSNDELIEKEKEIENRKKLIQELNTAIVVYEKDLSTKNQKEKELKIGYLLLKELEGKLITTISEWKSLQKEVDRLSEEEEHRKKFLSLEEHRYQLKQGEECPLCGALEHPFNKNAPIYKLQVDLLKTKKALLDKSNDLKTATISNIENKNNNNNQLLKEIDGIKENVGSKLSQLQELCKQLDIEVITSVDEVEKYEDTIRKDSDMLNKTKKAFELKAQLSKIENNTINWETAEKTKKTSIQKRVQIYSGTDISKEVDDISTGLTTNNEKRKGYTERLDSLKKELGVISVALQSLEDKLNLILKDAQIASIEQLKSFILEEQGAEDIRKKEVKLKLEKENLDTKKIQLLKDISKLEKQLNSKESLSTLKGKHTEVENKYNTDRDRVSQISNYLDTDTKSKEKQQKGLQLLDALKKEESLWSMMNKLIGDATGKKFSNFVQDLTLEQLIGYTNKRLEELSDRYILDIPTANEGAKNDSLKVFDRYMGDARRSVNTLSGGETFMVSLAMAFALSDLAAKNVNIESIFIDEGFGTLDSETLDHAITILEKMQNEGDKSIGIISHVAALKERISTQIRLEKTGSGYSIIDIV